MWNYNVVYIQINTNGTLLFSDEYNSGYEVADVVPVNNSYQEYSVRYTDGVSGETVFQDQTYTGLKFTDPHPEFLVDGQPGEPFRSGYTFEGWETSAEGKTAIYTATWKVIPGTLKVEKQFVGAVDVPENFKITVTGADGVTRTLALDDPGVEKEVSDDTMTYTWTIGDVSPGVYQAVESGYDIYGHTNQDGPSARYDTGTVVSNGTETLYLRNVYEVNEYTVTWNDGTQNLYTESVEYLTVPKYNQASYGAITAVGKVQTGWTDGITSEIFGVNEPLPAVTKNVTFTAVFTPVYTITYKDGLGGSLFADQVHHNILKGSKTPDFDGVGDSIVPERLGYTFTGWSPELSETVSGSATYHATWEADPSTEYRVEHYKMNIDGTWPTSPSETVTLTGITDTTAVAEAKSYSGYQVVSHDETMTSGTITAGEPLVLKLYYTKVFTLTFVDYDGSKEFVNNVPYGTSVASITSTKNPGDHTDPDYKYTFVGWDQTDPVDDETNVKSDMTFNAQYSATPILRKGTIYTYMDDNLMDLDARYKYSSVYVSTESSITSDTALIPTTKSAVGTYTVDLPSGNYYVYLKEISGDYYQVPNRILAIGQNITSVVRLDRYSVQYQDISVRNDHTTTTSILSTEYYFKGDQVLVSKMVPTKAGFVFDGWKDQYGTVYRPSTDNYSSLLSSSIEKRHLLTAQWKDAKTVNVVVTIDHMSNSSPAAINPSIGGTLQIHLTEKGSSGLYGDVSGKIVTVTVEDTNATTVTYDGIAFEELSAAVEHSARAELLGYTVVNVTKSAVSASEETVYIVLQYDPAGFELEFDVEFVHHKGTDINDADPRLVPEAIDVKIFYWDETKQPGGDWVLLEEAGGTGAGSVEVTNSSTDEAIWKGTGRYHVWGIADLNTNPATPYYYRVEVVGVDLIDDNYLYFDNDGKTTANGIFPGSAFTAGGIQTGLNPGDKGLHGNISGSSITGQVGKLTLTVKGFPYDVTFDPAGGVWSDSTMDAKTVKDRFTIPNLAEYVPTSDGALFRGWYTADDKLVQTSDHIYQYVTTPGGTLELHAKWAQERTINGEIFINNYYQLGDTIHYLYEFGRPTEVELHIHKVSNNNLVASRTLAITQSAWNTSGVALNYAISGLPNDGSEYYVEAELKNYVTTYQNVSGGAFLTTSNQAIFTDVEDTEATVNAKLTFKEESFDLHYVITGPGLGENFSLTVGAVVKSALQVGNSIDQWPIITQQLPGGVVTPDKVTVSAVHSGTGTYPVWKYHPNGETWLYAIRVWDYTANVNGVVDTVTYDAVDAPFTVTYTPNYDWVDGAPEYLTATLTPKTYKINYELDGGTKGAGTPENHVWSHNTPVPEPTRVGYTFLGWTVTPELGISEGKEVTIPAHVAKEVTLTANWAVDNNGDGTPDDQQVFVDYLTTSGGGVSTNAAIVTVSSGAAVVTAEAVTATADTGYTFTGWTLTSGEAVGVTFEAINPVIQPVFNTTAFGMTYVFTANFAVDKNNDGTPDAQQIFVEYRATSGGSVTIAEEAVTVSGVTVGALGSNAVTSTGIAFDGWVLTSGEAANVSFDGEKNLLKPEFKAGAAGETYVFTAVFASDENNDSVPDQYQKQITFRVTNGAWSVTNGGVDRADKTYTVTLKNPYTGKPAEDGRANISALIPDLSGVVADAGFTTEPTTFWSPAYPSSMYVNGTEPAVYVLNFPTTVEYDDHDAKDMVKVPMLNGGKIQIDPNGGAWDGYSNKQTVVVEVVSGTAYVLTPEAVRADHVFDGWTISEANDGEHIYVFTAQWIHRASLYYPVSVEIKLDDVLTTAGGVHPGSTGFYLMKTKDDPTKYPLTLSSSGIYVGEVRPGDYNLYREEGVEGHKVGNYIMIVDFDGGELTIDHYSVSYDTNEGSGVSVPRTDIYFYGTDVQVIEEVPTRAGYRFLGWQYNDDTSKYWKAGETFSGPNGIVTKAAFTAQWEDLINVKVNFTINFGEDDAANRNQVLFLLMNNIDGSMAPVGVKTTLNPNTANGLGYDWNYFTGTGDTTTSTSEAVGIKFVSRDYNYKDLVGGTYLINCAKNSYDVTVTSSATTSGDITIDVTLDFNPNDFNLRFTADVDSTIPNTLVPKNVNVKVLCWTDGQWKVINQQDSSAVPPVSVAISTDTRTGTGYYPVWISDHTTTNGAVTEPFYYRVMVTGFVYPDGTVRPATAVSAGELYTDGNYTASVQVTGGYDNISGTALTGAYYSSTAGISGQTGIINVHVSAETYDVTFDATGGAINGAAKYTVIEQYVVPTLSAFVPVRDNYIFRGWYTDPALTQTMASGTPLTENTTFYAKWEPIQAIAGTVYVDGLYDHAGTQTEVRSTCLPTRITVYLQKNDGKYAENISSQAVSVDWINVVQNHGIAAYEFAGLDALVAADYQIFVEETNYTSSYVNAASASAGAFTSGNNKAVFNTDPTRTYVNVQLQFTPDTFDQVVRVDASQIGDGYRPETVRTQFQYKEQNTTNAYHVINEHTVFPYGINVSLTSGAVGEATQTGLWKRSWHQNNPYDYQAVLTKIGDTDYNAETFPFTVSYGNAVYWNGAGSTGPLTMTLTPKTYDIIYDYGDSETVSTGAHTWSFETALSTEVPTRTGLVFMGWYDNEDLQGEPVTSINASVAENSRVYAKWETDTLQENPDQTIGDGIPDIYQCVVQFRIIGGTWGDKGGSAPIGHVYTLKEKNAEGQWVDKDTRLGNRIPTNMKCVDENTTQGSWNVDINSETPVTGPRTYTYTYTHSVTLIVQNGTVSTTGGQIYTNTTVTLPVDHNAAASELCEFQFTPQSGYVLKSVTIDNVPTTAGFNASGSGIVKVNQQQSHRIVVIYDVDVNRDGIADSFQKKVIFQVVNGSWNEQGNPTLISRYVTLTTDGGVAAEDGIATISAIVPTATPAAGYKGGRWDVDPAVTVSGTGDITYTYRYQKINYLDYHYAIHHELQQPSGNYAEDTGSMVQRMIQIELTLEGDGFESGKVPTLTVEPSDYKDYGSHYHVNTAASITTAAPVYRATGNTAQTAHRLTIRYDLDEHTLTYDTNGGSAVDSVTTRCGLEIDLAAAPTKAGHVFAGWLVTSGTAVGTTYQAGDGFEFTQDTVMTAQWVDDVNNDGIPDAQQIFVTYRATTGGAVSSTSEAVTMSGETAIATGTTATTTGSFAFDGWVLTSGTAANVTFDREKTLLKPEFTKLAAGETYVFTAVFADDSNNDGIADKYQKDIVFRVTNGAWSTSSDTADIEHTVTLLKDGKPSLDGTADITSLIPDKSLAVANAGYITTTAPFWSPELPNNGIVSGTGEEAFTLNFYTTVTYDDYATTEAGIVPIRPGEKILVDPEGGSWNGFTADQEVIVNVDGGEAYTLTPEAIRDEHVFNGWKCEAGTDGIHTYVFKAQWIHKKDLTYPVTVTGKLDNEVVTVGALHEGSTGIRLVLDTDANKKYNLTETTSGAYTGTVPPGAYRIYRMEGDSEHRVGDFLLTVTYEGGSLEINHYSVNYDLAGGTAVSLKMQEVYFRGTGDIRVTNIVPSRAGFEFTGWKNSVDEQIYQPGSVLTNGITTKTTLTAVWKELIDIKVNVIVNYGEDTASNRDEVTFQLMSILNNARAMMPVKAPVTLTTEGAATTYNAVEITSGGSVIGVSYGGFTYKDLPQGSYTINCVKSGYNVSISAISTAELTEDTTFTIILTFEPNDFDLNFKVDVDDSIPDELVPKHVNVKVTCWDSEEGKWKIINQQAGVGSSPYVVNIQKDGSNNDTGEGSYPVWMMDHRIGSGDDVPFYYRVMVTGFGYPDALGTVKNAQEIAPSVKYTDGNYTAEIVVDGGETVTTGGLAGAFQTTAATTQTGIITVKVKAETYDVVFNGNGGTVTGSAVTNGAVVTMSAQYLVPDLASITAIRDNYIFRGWYTDPGFTKTIESGAVLVTDVALYAKWEPIQEISGTIEVDGLYDHGGHQTPVRETCKPSKVRVTLERYDGVLHPIQFTDVNVTWSGNVGSASYEFTSLAALNSGHYYQISINEINYTTEYSNADPDDFSTNAAFQKAVFSLTTPTATYVNAKLHFTPDSFAQKVQVDVTSIGAAFRPGDVKVQYLYTRHGTSSQNVISEHSVTPHGLVVDMNTASGIGSATQPGLWKRAWNSDYNTVVLYDYQAELLKVGRVDYEPASAPYTVSYGEPVYWNKDISNSSGILTVKLTPKNYNIQYVLDGGELASGSPTKHIWSHDTNVPAATRDGYIFLGWTADHAEVTSGTSVTIPGSVAQNVTLTAHWTLDTNKDGTPDDQQVFIKYQAGPNGTVTVTSEAITLSGNTTSAVGSTANAGGGFAFDGWTLNTSGSTGAVTYIAENPAIAPSFTEAAAGHTYTFTANFAVSANGDDVPDYKQGFIVFTADANGKVEGATKQAFTLTKGALGYTGKVTPEMVTAKAITSGYAFDFWTIDGTTPVDPFVEQTLEGGTTVTYTAKFAVDGNNDGKPDKYQKLVTFKVINGTWNLTGNPTSTAFYADLDEFGKADITSKVPYPTANPNFTNSVWDNSPYSDERNTSVIVSGTDAVTYTLRYTAYTYQYTIEHYKQDTNGGYSLDATTTGTGVATINAENTGFVTGHALSVGSYDHKDYGSHYSVVRTTTGAPVYTPGVGVITPPALQVYYDLDQHTLTYVHGNGVSNEVITTRHGITLTVKDAPTKAGFVFKGWEASGGLTGTFTTGQTIDLTDDVELTAIWKEDVNGDGTPDEDQKVITFLVENGTWNSTGNSDPIVLYITLSGGTADITDRIPTASAIEHCTGGAWNTTLDGTVSGTAPAIYTYRFGSYIYDYTIRHEKQKLDGTYELVETETKSEVIQLNNTNNGFANVPIIEVTSYRDFGEHYLVDVTSSAIKATAIYGQPLTLVVKYALDDHTLTYVHENGTSDEAITVRHGSTLIVKAPTRSGYTFQHWIATTAAGVETTTYAALSNITLNENTTLTAVWTLIPVTPGGGGGMGGGGQENPEDKIPDEFTKDHNAFVSGYTDGTIRPEGKITRAEVAAIFYNLLTDEIRAQYTKDVYSRSFSDVSEGKWFYTAVSAMAEMGVINGYPDGTFKPNGQITRAEFAAIASKFGDHAGEAGAAFSDIDGHWGSSLIDAVAGKGWVSGYTDGTFKPNQKVTRAEAMAIVNNVLQRIPQDLHSLLPGMKTWPDNANTSKWYYLTVQEASNSHDYERNADGTESWTRLK